MDIERGISGRVSLMDIERGVSARVSLMGVGRRVGVRTTKGTPPTSSRCLCMSSRTFSSVCTTVSMCTSDPLSTYRLAVHAVRGLEQTLELILLLVDKEGDDLANECALVVVVVVNALVPSPERTEQRPCVRKAVSHHWEDGCDM